MNAMEAARAPGPHGSHRTMTGKALCPAHNRNGEPCRNRAGKGTDHVGYGLCMFHGGSSPGGRVQGENLKATAEAWASLEASGISMRYLTNKQTTWAASVLTEFANAILADLDAQGVEATVLDSLCERIYGMMRDAAVAAGPGAGAHHPYGTVLGGQL